MLRQIDTDFGVHVFGNNILRYLNYNLWYISIINKYDNRMISRYDQFVYVNKYKYINPIVSISKVNNIIYFDLINMYAEFIKDSGLRNAEWLLTLLGAYNKDISLVVNPAGLISAFSNAFGDYYNYSDKGIYIVDSYNTIDNVFGNAQLQPYILKKSDNTIITNTSTIELSMNRRSFEELEDPLARSNIRLTCVDAPKSICRVDVLDNPSNYELDAIVWNLHLTIYLTRKEEKKNFLILNIIIHLLKYIN